MPGYDLAQVGCARGVRGSLRLGPAVVAALFTAALVPATAEPARTSPFRALVIRGHGFGHGIGLSQWGAEERAKAGEDYRQILGFYYPGTQLTAAAPVRVRILVGHGPVATIGSSKPFTLHDASGAALRLAAGRYRVTPAGVVAGRTVLFPLVATRGRAPLTLGPTPYDGTLTVSVDGAALQTVDTLGLEDYLVGVVSSEDPAYWSAQALQVQAVASRTYALANLRPQATFDLYADDRSQNYRGLARRFPSASNAVAATRGQVLEYDGALADTLFSAANGGLTSVPDGVWAALQPAPYLVVRRDPFDARSPDSSWGPVVVPLARLAKLVPQLPEHIVGVATALNAGDRVTSVEFTGADGSVVSVPGTLFQRKLGLRSTYLTLRLASSG